MKKSLVLIVVLALVFCTIATVSAADSKGLIYVITPSHSNPFFGSEATIAVAKAEELGYTTKSVVHDDDANKQMELFETAIADGAVAIILDNAGADALSVLFRKPKMPAPAFLIDRESGRRYCSCSDISNNYQGASLVAEYFVELMGEEGTYIELTGRDTDTNAHVRSQGYHDVIDEYEGMEMIAQDTANWDQTEAFEKMETMLQSNPDVKGVICGNDTMALGAKRHWMLPAKRCIVAAFDGSDDVIQFNQRRRY